MNTLMSFKEKTGMALLLFFVLALMLLPTVLLAQSSGKLSGTATDSNGAAVHKANVVLTEQSTGAVYRAVTGDQGIYTFSDVTPGTYNVTVTAPNFKQYSQDGITVAVGLTATVNATLDVGATNEVVTVNADASQLQTDTSDVGTSISPKLLEDLPLSFNGAVRDPLQFVTLTPGYAGSVSNSPTSPPSGGFKINGGQQDGVQVLLDGANLNLISANMQVNYGVSVEAVAEFKVESNTFNAEYGKASGGLVNLVTKSGTNQFHGAVYDLLKNRDLDANNWVSNYDGTMRPIDTQNDFGGIISGPVRIPKLYNGRDKTFFLFNYEGFRFDTGGVGLYSAPTTAMQGGDFSALLNPITVEGQNFPAHIIYDYRTCTGANQGKVCTPFPGNIIDPSLEDPIFKARRLLANDPESRFQMAKACLNTGHGPAALELIQSLAQTQITPSEEYELAVLLSEKHFYPEAVKRFEYVAAAAPNSWAALYDLAIAEINAGQPDKAIPILQSVAQQQAALSSVFSFLGSAYESTNQLPQALDEYRKAVQADPQNPDHYLDYTRLLMDLDRTEEATRIIEQGISETASTEDPYALDLRLGVLRLKQARFDDARTAINQAIALQPDLVVGYVALAQSFMQQGSDDKAIEPLLKARATLPQDATLEYYVGLISLRLGKVAEAEIALKNSVRLRPDMVESHYQLGKLYTQTDRISQARTEFKCVIGLAPANSSAHYQLSKLYAKLGETQKATEMADETRRLMQTQREAALARQKTHLAAFQAPQ